MRDVNFDGAAVGHNPRQRRLIATIASNHTVKLSHLRSSTYGDSREVKPDEEARAISSVPGYGMKSPAWVSPQDSEAVSLSTCSSAPNKFPKGADRLTPPLLTFLAQPRL
jgi:hypothetical protein